MILPVRGGGFVEVPDAVACPGPCGGVAGYRGSLGLPCPVCLSSGRVSAKVPEVTLPIGAAKAGRWQMPRFEGRGSVRKRRVKVWRGAGKREREQAARVQARNLDNERKLFFAEGRAPDPALLDQLKAQFRAKMKGNR